MKNMTLGKRLAIGFGVVLIALIVLGGTGYAMFSRVSDNVNVLTKHYMPAVTFVTDVERAAFQCILQEKNTVLYKKDESYEAAKKYLADLTESLNRVDGVAKEHDNKTLLAASGEVRAISGEFAKLFDTGVAAIKSNTENEAVLNSKGEEVETEALEYLATKKSQYLQEKDALNVVNRINALALDTRMNEKSYMLYKEQKYYDVIAANITEMIGCYDQLEKLNPTPVEQTQISDARKATQDYFEAAKAWVAEYGLDPNSPNLTQLAATMDTTSAIVNKAAVDYLAAKKAAVDRSAEAVFIVAAISSEAMNTRLNEKAYIINQQEENWKALNDHITKLDGLFDELAKVSSSDDDKGRIEIGRAHV